MTKKHHCSAEVYGGMARYACGRPGTIFENDTWWCWQHAPSAEEKRLAESNARFEVKFAKRKAGWARDKAFKVIAETAIALSHQQATMDDLEKAVIEYERLKEQA